MSGQPTGDGDFDATRTVSGKLVELEALRGVAATIVLLHHFLLCIAPRLEGRNFPDDPIALVRTPLFAFVNGTAAVAVFFVLSGFVLTLRAMERRDWKQLIVGAIKRWPRLVPLVVMTNVFSSILFILGLYAHSDWFNLSRYVDVGTFGHQLAVVHGAIAEGAYTTFFRGSSKFNAALWTMHYEFFGSFAAYATALILIFQTSLARAMAGGLAAILITVAFTGEGGVYFAMLVAGAVIARIYIERDTVTRYFAFAAPWRLPLAVATASVVLVLMGFDGYSKPVGFYAIAAPFASPRIEPYVHGLAAVIILLSVLFCDRIRWMLAGPTAKFLGRMSFPVYLVHLPILIGVVLPIHAALVVHFGLVLALPATLAIFVALTLIAAYPLAHLDEWWIRELRHMTGRPN